LEHDQIFFVFVQGNMTKLFVCIMHNQRPSWTFFLICWDGTMQKLNK